MNLSDTMLLRDHQIHQYRTSLKTCFSCLVSKPCLFRTKFVSESFLILFLLFTLNDHTDYCTVLLDPVISGCHAPGGLDQFGKVSPATPAMGGGGGGEGV